MNKNQEILPLFIESAKTFDSVNRQELSTFLQKMGIHEKMKAVVMSGGESRFHSMLQAVQSNVVLWTLFCFHSSFQLCFDMILAKFKVAPNSSFEQVLAFSITRISTVENCKVQDLLSSNNAALIATFLDKGQEVLDQFSAA